MFWKCFGKMVCILPIRTFLTIHLCRTSKSRYYLGGSTDHLPRCGWQSVYWLYYCEIIRWYLLFDASRHAWQQIRQGCAGKVVFNFWGFGYGGDGLPQSDPFANLRLWGRSHDWNGIAFGNRLHRNTHYPWLFESGDPLYIHLRSSFKSCRTAWRSEWKIRNGPVWFNIFLRLRASCCRKW